MNEPRLTKEMWIESLKKFHSVNSVSCKWAYEKLSKIVESDGKENNEKSNS